VGVARMETFARADISPKNPPLELCCHKGSSDLTTMPDSELLNRC